MEVAKEEEEEEEEMGILLVFNWEAHVHRACVCVGARGNVNNNLLEIV